MINIIKLEIKDTDLVERVSIVRSSVKVIKELIKFRDFLLASESTALSDFDLASDVLLKSEELLNVDWSVLKATCERRLGDSASIRRRLMMFEESYKTLVNRIERNTSMWLSYDEATYTQILNTSNESLGQLCCYLYYQFSLGTVYNLEEGEEIKELSDAIDYWKTDDSVSDSDLKDLVEVIFNYLLKCNPSMGVFERHPELLAPFEELVGQSIYDCEDMSLLDIKNVTSGKISPEDFIEALEKKHEKNGEV